MTLKSKSLVAICRSGITTFHRCGAAAFRRHGVPFHGGVAATFVAALLSPFAEAELRPFADTHTLVMAIFDLVLGEEKFETRLKKRRELKVWRYFGRVINSVGLDSISLDLNLTDVARSGRLYLNG